MAGTAIGLGVQFTASTSGLTKGLSQVDRQLQTLAKQAGDSARLFDQFAGSNSAAAAAQQQLATDVAFLNSALRTGQVSSEEYVAQLQQLTQAGREQAAAFSEGARITEQVATSEEKRTAQLERLGQLLAAGAISQQTYERAVAEANGTTAAAAAAEQERARAQARAQQITQANATATERYDATMLELRQHLDAGRISQETFNRAVERASQILRNAGSQAETTGLQFNELSGIFAAIPGPIGNIAGRLSGLASAGKGLTRIFSGGLSAGISSITAGFASLINPVTATLAAVTGFAAGATAVARGLAELEDRVENLGNIASKLGTSFEFVQVLEEAAQRSGTSIDTVSAAFGRLQKSVLGVDEESKAAQAALAGIGVTAEQLQSLSPEEQYRLIGASLAAIEDPAKRTATAIALFGRSGADLIPFFNNLGNAAADIERLGGSLSDLDRRNIDEFGDGLDQLGVASSRLGELLLVRFTGLGEGIAQGTAEFLAGINSIVQVAGNVLQPVLFSIGTAVEVVGIVFGTLGRIIGEIFSPLGELASAFGAVGESFNEYITGVLRGLSDSLVSLTEWIAAFGPISIIADVISELGDVFSRVFTIIATLAGNAAQFIQDLGSSFVDFISSSDLLSTVAGGLSAVFETLGAAIQFVKDTIFGAVDGILSAAESWLGIERNADAAGEAASDSASSVVDANDRITDSVRRLTEASLEQLRIEKEFGGDSQRAAAAERLEAVQQSIAEQEQRIAQARQDGDQAAIDAGEQRLAQLREAEAREQDIASGAKKAREEQAKAAEDARREQERQQEQSARDAQRAAEQAERDRTRAAEQAERDRAKAVQDAQRERERQEQRIADATKKREEDIARIQERLSEKSGDIESQRLESLSRRNQTALQGNDIRSSEGISQFLALATGREDQSIIEYRKQLSELQQIRKELREAQARPVEIG